MQATGKPILLNDGKDSKKVLGRAAQSAIIKVPGIDGKTWYLLLDPLDEGLESQEQVPGIDGKTWYLLLDPLDEGSESQKRSQVGLEDPLAGHRSS